MPEQRNLTRKFTPQATLVIRAQRPSLALRVLRLPANVLLWYEMTLSSPYPSPVQYLTAHLLPLQLAQVKETVEEKKVKIQERVIKSTTPDGKTILTKITTLPGEEIEEIEEETTETIDGETKTNKSKSQVVKAPFPVSMLPGGKEIPIKPNMKEGETTTDYDEQTKTTVVTKRLANGYEQTFTTITPEGNNKSWTKTFFDPVAVEGDEEEEEIEEYEEVETTEASKKTTTTTQQDPKATPVKSPAKAPTPAAATTKTTTQTPSGAKPTSTPAATPAKTTTTTTTTPQAAKPKVTPSEKTVVKKIPNGKQEITTTIDAEGRETTKIHTMQDLPDQAEEYEEYEETHITEESPKTKKTTTTTHTPTPVPQKKPQQPQQQVVPKNTTTIVAVPGKNPKDNVMARKVVTKGEEEIQITEEHTETEFSPSKKRTVNTNVVPSTGEKLDPKGKTTVTKVVIPGSQNTVVTKSNEQDGKQIVVKKGPSGTQNISKTTNPDGSSKVQVTTTVNPEEISIEETETTNIIGDKTITTTRTEVPIPGKKIVKPGPTITVPGKGPKTTTTTTTTTMPVGVDRKTTTTKRVDQGTEVSVKTETKDGKTRLETRTMFDPIFHPAVSDGEEEIEEFEETQTFAPVKTKTTTTTKVPVTSDAGKKKPAGAASSKVTPSSAAAAKK